MTKEKAMEQNKQLGNIEGASKTIRSIDAVILVMASICWIVGIEKTETSIWRTLEDSVDQQSAHNPYLPSWLEMGPHLGGFASLRLRMK